jgi:hypothetical protein
MQTTKSRIYSPEILAMLCRILDESFRTIVGSGTLVDNEWRDEIRSRLAQVIIVAFERGEHDPLVLQRTAISVIAPAYIKTTGVH